MLVIARLNIFKPDAPFLGPVLDGAADALRPVVTANHLWFAAPDLMDTLWQRQRLRPLPYQAFPRLDAQRELQLPVDALHALMAPAETLHVAQIQLAQAKAPIAVVIRQADQPVGNFFILSVLLGLAALAGLADPKCWAGHCDGDTALLNCVLGHLVSARRPHHFFASASATISALSFSSKYIFLRRWFSSSSSFMRAICAWMHTPHS